MAARSDLASRAKRGRGRLQYVNDIDRGLGRRRCGLGFVYLSTRGTRIRCKRTMRRIDALAIPPAWTDVWICPDPRGHIQAVGRDATGRKQYIYHPDWEFIRAQTKYERMEAMADRLPRIRRRVRRDLAEDELTWQRAVASVVRLIDKTNIRVGNVAYVRTHGSRGATTLTARNVDCRGPKITLSFPGKSGKKVETELTDAQVMDVVRRCEQIDGQFLFCYRADEEGDYRSVLSTDVNEYLKDTAGTPITAKDFRTWWASVRALKALSDYEALDPDSTQRKKLAVKAVAGVADRLGNTRAVCRQSYIHPGLLSAFENGTLARLLAGIESSCPRRAELTVDEARFVQILAFLE